MNTPTATHASAGSGDRPVFFLGTHQPGWLARVGVPLFVSDRRLRDYRRLPLAADVWAADSGGFTELQQYGTWTVTPAEYVARLRRYGDQAGRLAWAAPQDWMCEPAIINGGRFGPVVFAGTHLSVAEHQARTVANYLTLRDLAPELPIIPVVQGWTLADYLRCFDAYTAAGVDLTAEPLVGVGSVCRRQDTCEAGDILTALHHAGVTRLHGFGFKTLGLLAHGHLLTSADSLAWSYGARRRPPLPECTGRHRNCANCPRYATAWRTQLLAALAAADQAGRQLTLPLLTGARVTALLPRPAVPIREPAGLDQAGEAASSTATAHAGDGGTSTQYTQYTEPDRPWSQAVSGSPRFGHVSPRNSRNPTPAPLDRSPAARAAPPDAA